MDELFAFILQLGNDKLSNNEPFMENKQMNEMWIELDDYFDKAFVDVDAFLNELIPDAKPRSPETEPEILQNSLVQRADENDIALSTLPTSTELFAKPNNLIPITYHKLHFQDKCFLPSELILASIRQKIAMFNIEHPRCTPTTSNRLSTLLDENNTAQKGYVAVIDNSMQPFTAAKTSEDCVSFEESQQYPINTISDKTDWVNILENVIIYPGVTVDNVLDKMQIWMSAPEKSVPTKSDVYDIVSSLFHVLNNYIDRLTVEFADNKCFDDSQFDDLSHELYEAALSSSNIKISTLLRVLDDWAKMITEKFVVINKQRRQVEEKISKDVINQAVEMYKTRIESSNGRTSILSNEKEIIVDGVRRTYSNCGSNIQASILRDLENRLEEVNSKLNNVDQTTSRNDYNIKIQVLLAEYSRNINQKGIQCASISTLQQFDNVNKNCRADIVQHFEKFMNETGETLVNRNILKQRFERELDSESEKKRLEYERKICELPVPHGLHSSYTRSYYIGIHFGIESLSVSYFDKPNYTFRSIYGPSANLISFAEQGVFIDGIPLCQNVQTFDMNSMLTSLESDVLHNTKFHGQLKLAEIIALILMQIDQITKRSMHQESGIKYAIAIPSCLNQCMQNTFDSAMKIAKIEGNLVREQCALMTFFLHENHQTVIKNNDTHLIALIENSNLSCDSVGYEVIPQNKMNKIQISQVNGFDKESGFKTYLISGQPGITLALQKMLKYNKKRCRFIINCSTKRRGDITKLIKNQFWNAKINFASMNMVSNGSSLLSSIANGNCSYVSSFDLKCSTSIQERRVSKAPYVYRIKHTGHELPREYLQEASMKLNNLIENQSQIFKLEKARAKQFLIGKTKDLEQSQLPEYKKDQLRQQLENNLKEVEEEVINVFAIEKIVDDCN